MAAAFRSIVGDPEETSEGWTWKKAKEREANSGPDDDTAEPWISTLEMPGARQSGGPELDAASISSNLVRMMVSTTLVTITRLSQLIYDSRRGLARQKHRAKGQSVMLQTLTEMDEVGEELTEAADAAAIAINTGALELARTEEEELPSPAGSAAGSPERPATPPSGAAAPPEVFDNSTSYSQAVLESKRKRIVSRIKARLGTAGVDAEEVMLDEPADLDELINNILDGERYQRKGAELPQLLPVNTSVVPVKYYRSLKVTAEGAQRLVYDAVRLRRDPEAPTKTTQDLAVMKEFKQSFAHGNSIYRYIQMCQGNVVASFLAQLFNATCAEKGITEVEGSPRPDLVYMPMWTASWWVDDLKAPNGRFRCNHHVEPYILGKYIKYNSNAGAVNMSTLNDVCHTFSHWTYHQSKGILMVTDVQGIKDHATRKVLLTDPAVHCVPLVDGYFDAESNRGPFGVKEFFLSHVCNDACKKLGLRSAEEELTKLRADALAGRLPGRHGTVLDLDSGM